MPSSSVALNRRINEKITSQNLYQFSSASAIDPDDDDNKSDMGAVGSDVAALRANIENLKVSEVQNFEQESVADDDGEYMIDKSQLGKRADAQTLLDVLKSSPFEQSLSSETTSSTSFEPLDTEDNVNESTNTTNHNETSSRPTLSELLQTDIFTKSWSDGEESMPSPSMRTTGYRGSSEYIRNEPQNDAVSSSTSLLDLLSQTPTDKPTSGEDDMSGLSGQSQPTPAEIEYNKILEQTNDLLDRLSNTDDSSTLQLMDFDNVMTQWSRFHAEVDSVGNEGNVNSFDGYSDGSGYLKRKASEQCVKLLEALENNYDCILQPALRGDPPETKHTQLMPNAASYNLALYALAHSEKGQHIAGEAYSILMRMLDRCQNYLDILESDDEEIAAAKLPPPPFEPTIITYNSVVHAIAKSGARDASYLAEEAFAKMEQWRGQCEETNSRNERTVEEDANNSPTDGELAPTLINLYSPQRRTCSYHGVLPNARTLACVIDAWANAKTTQHQSFAPERAEAILDLAIKKRRAYVEYVTGEVHEHDNYFIDIQSSGEEEERNIDIVEDGVEEEALDEELFVVEHVTTASSQDDEDEELPSQQSETVAMPALKPNTVAFNTCINVWAASISSRGREGALRAQELLHRHQALSESGELELPSELSHGAIDNEDSHDADSILKPNVRSYSLVMNAWANVAKLESNDVGGEAASRCEEILTRMEESTSVLPNLVVYVTSISAWARTNGVDYAASRAENILNRMIDLYYSEDQTDLPILDGDVKNASHDAPFNSVITAYARSSDSYAAERALAVLQRLEASPILPTGTTYNAVMDCCAKHGEPERALEIFNRMQEMSIPKDSTSYDTVLNAFARDKRAGSAERAYDFLCQLEEEHSSGESNFIPSSLSYATVINAFARCSGEEFGGLGTVKKAKEIYEKLITQMRDGLIYGNPDPFANSCFLNCCANVYGTSSEKKESLVMAIIAYEDMKRQPALHGQPSQYTFGTMMKACARLSSDAAERDRLLTAVFVQACRRGCVSRTVLGQFLRHTPSHLSMKVILSQGGTKREIPESWYNNVPRRNWPQPLEH